MPKNMSKDIKTEIPGKDDNDSFSAGNQIKNEKSGVAAGVGSTPLLKEPILKQWATRCLVRPRISTPEATKVKYQPIK